MSEEHNPRVVGLVRARANQIRAANPGASPADMAVAARDAALRLCSQSLRPGRAVTFDEAIEVAALVEYWQTALSYLGQPLKVLETFRGFVDRIDGDTGYVTIESTTTGDKFYGQYPAAKFAEKGIEEEDQFICRTIELVGGDTRIEIEAAPKAEVSDEEAKAIAEEMRRAFPGDSMEVLY